MVGTKNQFYIKGVDNQKRADLTCELKRMDLKKFKALSYEDKIKIITFLSQFRTELSRVIKMFDTEANY